MCLCAFVVCARAGDPALSTRASRVAKEGRLSWAERKEVELS